MSDAKFFEACQEVKDFVESHDVFWTPVKNTAKQYYSLHEDLVQILEESIEFINDKDNEVSKKLSAHVAYFKPFLLLHQKEYKYRCCKC